MSFTYDTSSLGRLTTFLYQTCSKLVENKFFIFQPTSSNRCRKWHSMQRSVTELPCELWGSSSNFNFCASVGVRVTFALHPPEQTNFRAWCANCGTVLPVNQKKSTAVEKQRCISSIFGNSSSRTALAGCRQKIAMLSHKQGIMHKYDGR
jgi:hypothetical protein